MKQAVLAGALLLAMLICGVASRSYTGSFSREIGEELAAARAGVEAGDWDKAERGMLSAMSRWEDSRKVMGFIAADAELAAVDAALAGVYSALENRDGAELDTQIRLVTLLLGVLVEQERLTWQNLG